MSEELDGFDHPESCSPTVVEILEYSDDEVGNIERVNNSIASREQAIANKESQKKMRILFERAAEEVLPFIVYVIYGASLALVAIFHLLNQSGVVLYIGSIIILVALIAPLTVLPGNPFERLVDIFED